MDKGIITAFRHRFGGQRELIDQSTASFAFVVAQTLVILL